MEINLTWQVLDDDHIALVFDKPVWELFRARATERGILATEMIGDAVAALLGPMVSRRSNDTYNPQNGHFTCTECYVAMGCPSGPLGKWWKAP